MMMALYMITQERKGEWFKVTDVEYILTDVFGESVTRKQIEGVFARNKTWFRSEKAENGNKEVKRKLLNSGLEFAKGLLDNAV
jgi:hypothetical protein